MGRLRFALVASPPSPQVAVEGEHAVPLPAIVVMIPDADTLRTRLSLRSAMNKLPAPSTMAALG